MFRSLITGRVVTALVAGGILALAQLSGPATVTTAPAIENVDYHERAETVTDVSVAKKQMRQGQSNRATAVVSSNTGQPQGTVTFRISGGNGSQTVPLRNGRATYDIPRDLAPGDYTVTAQYNGNKVYKGSSDSTTFTVFAKGSGNVDNGNGNGGGGSDSGGGAGGDGNGGDNGGGSGDGSGNGTGNGAAGDGSGTAGDEGDLPATGAEGNTILFTLIGLGLLALGATTLAGRRRFLTRT